MEFRHVIDSIPDLITRIEYGKRTLCDRFDISFLKFFELFFKVFDDLISFIIVTLLLEALYLLFLGLKFKESLLQLIILSCKLIFFLLETFFEVSHLLLHVGIALSISILWLQIGATTIFL